MKNAPKELLEAAFETFWSEWPRRTAKIDAKKAWTALAKAGRLPPIEVIVAAIRTQCRHPSWREKGGRFIPYPAKWLRKEQWADEAPGALGSRLSAAPASPVVAPREPDPELLALAARGEAYSRIDQAVADGWMPAESDLALVRSDALAIACRRFGVDPASLEPRPESPEGGEP